MDKSTYVSDLYSSVSEEFLKDIDESNLFKAREAYIAYLHETYDYLFESKPESDYETIAALCEGNERIEHFDLDEEGKLAFLFPDPFFMEIQSISFEIAALARKKKAGVELIFDKTQDQFVEQLENCASRISAPFKFSANKLLSEAYLDLAYVYDNGGVQSFRTSILQTRK